MKPMIWHMPNKSLSTAMAQLNQEPRAEHRTKGRAHEGSKTREREKEREGGGRDRLNKRERKNEEEKSERQGEKERERRGGERQIE